MSSEAADSDQAETESRVVVLTVDGLGAGFLGPYGNTWIETPGANRLASESLLVENFLVEAPDPCEFLQSVISGTHFARRSTVESANALAGGEPTDSGHGSDLCTSLHSSQRRSILITDDHAFSESKSADAFDEILFVENPEPARADEVEESELGRLFATAIDALENDSTSSLIWIHSTGINATWDAPLELRNQFADEEDPDAPELLLPPSLILDKDHDPDEVTGISFACAGQVVAFDYCLAALHDCIAAIPESRQPLFLLAGTRGFPLGEHGAIGNSATGLFEELIHTPLLIRSPHESIAMTRSQLICQPHDLYEVIRQWLLPSNKESTSALDRIAHPCPSDDRKILLSDQQLAIRSSQWYLVCDRDRNSTEQPQLFVKPDDRWEVNEISSRCREKCSELEDLLRKTLADSQKLEKRE